MCLDYSNLRGAQIKGSVANTRAIASHKGSGIDSRRDLMIGDRDSIPPIQRHLTDVGGGSKGDRTQRSQLEEARVVR